MTRLSLQMWGWPRARGTTWRSRGCWAPTPRSRDRLAAGKRDRIGRYCDDAAERDFCDPPTVRRFSAGLSEVDALDPTTYQLVVDRTRCSVEANYDPFARFELTNPRRKCAHNGNSCRSPCARNAGRPVMNCPQRLSRWIQLPYLRWQVRLNSKRKHDTSSES